MRRTATSNGPTCRRRTFVCRWHPFPRATRLRMLLEHHGAIARAHRCPLQVQRGSNPGPYRTKVDFAAFQLLKRLSASRIRWSDVWIWMTRRRPHSRHLRPHLHRDLDFAERGRSRHRNRSLRPSLLEWNSRRLYPSKPIMKRPLALRTPRAPPCSCG